MIYLLGYGSFLLGVVLYILGKMQKFKDLADANPDPKVKASWKNMVSKEAINFARLLIGGLALIFFAPMLTGGVSVDFKSTEGVVITTLSLKDILIPFYFFIGYGGNSALFNFFGVYEKTLLNRVGVQEPNPNH